jgi:hypothetical protein
MKRIVVIALVGLAASAAAGAEQPGPVRTTAKAVEPFARCFAEAQDRASRPWWFVPRGRGGTFSNLGAKGVDRPYFLEIADRGSRRTIRLTSGSPDPATVRAVESCI